MQELNDDSLKLFKKLVPGPTLIQPPGEEFSARWCHALLFAMISTQQLTSNARVARMMISTELPP